jgi:hypothetical protein
MSDTVSPTSVTDAGGRKIGLRKLTVVDQVKILRAIGPRQAENQPYVQVVEVACMAADIDGVPIPFPTNEVQIDAVLTRLGDDGVNSLMAVRMAEVRRGIEAAEAAAAEGATRAGPLTPSGS